MRGFIILIRILCLSGCVLLAACEAEPLAVVGTLEADRIELVAPEAEVIQRIAVREGDRVSRGQLLLQLDTTSAAAEVDALTAARDRAAARVAELERGPRREMIAQARAVVDGSRSQLAQARNNLDRQLSLQRQQLASAEALESAQTNVDSSVARLKADQENLKALESGTTSEERQQARFALAQMQAQLVPAQVRLNKLSIVAPVDGVVDDIVFEEGEQPNRQVVVAVILASDRRYARVYVPQPFRNAVHIGLQLAVQIDGLPQSLTGTVTRISVDPVFTPYYALTQRDRSRLAYLAEVELPVDSVSKLAVGLPLEVILPAGGE